MEGMTPQVIIDCLKRAGATIEGECSALTGGITKQDFMQWGLSGGVDSSQHRKTILRNLGFPDNMSANAMLQAVNILFTRNEFEKYLGESND